MNTTVTTPEMVYAEGFAAGMDRWQMGMTLTPPEAPKYRDHTPGTPFYAGEWERGYRAAAGQIVADRPSRPVPVHELRDSDGFAGLEVGSRSAKIYLSPEGTLLSVCPAGVRSRNDITPSEEGVIERVANLARAFAYHGVNDLHGQAFLSWSQAVGNVLTLPAAAAGLEVNTVDFVAGMARAGWSRSLVPDGFVHVR